MTHRYLQIHQILNLIKGMCNAIELCSSLEVIFPWSPWIEIANFPKKVSLNGQDECASGFAEEWVTSTMHSFLFRTNKSFGTCFATWLYLTALLSMWVGPRLNKDLFGQKCQKVEIGENRCFAIISSKLVRNWFCKRHLLRNHIFHNACFLYVL